MKEQLNKLSGLLLTCVFVPALYAGCRFYLDIARIGGGVPTSYALLHAFLFAIPLAVSGVVKWWDVWVKPMPKLGALCVSQSPSEYVRNVLLGQGMVAVACIISQLSLEQKHEFGQPPYYDFAEARDRVRDLKNKQSAAEARLRSLRDPVGLTAETLQYNNARIDAIQQAGAARMEWESLEDEIAREQKKVDLAKVNPSEPLYILLIGAAGTLILVPVRFSEHSGQPIRQG